MPFLYPILDIFLHFRKDFHRFEGYFAMCLDLLVQIGHTVKLLKKPRKNQGFSRVRSFHATLELAVFAFDFGFPTCKF